MKLVKKLSAKQILGNVAKVIADSNIEVDQEIELYSLLGVCKGIKTGISTYGNWTSFEGNMEAVNFVTGEIFSSSTCFIPEPLNTILIDALEKNETIEFSFKVHAKRLANDPQTGAISYEYIVEPIKAAQETDPLKHLRDLSPKLLQPVKQEVETEQVKDDEKSPPSKKGKK
jgi:hypothetical protein